MKDKAKQLVEKYLDADYSDLSINGAQQCALICVDEIIINLVTIVKTTTNTPLDLGLGYWQGVKEEITKL